MMMMMKDLQKVHITFIVAFNYLTHLEPDDTMDDIKTTLKQILECQQSLMRRLEIVENAIKGQCIILLL